MVATMLHIDGKWNQMVVGQMYSVTLMTTWMRKLCGYEKDWQTLHRCKECRQFYTSKWRRDEIGSWHS